MYDYRDGRCPWAPREPATLDVERQKRRGKEYVRDTCKNRSQRYRYLAASDTLHDIPHDRPADSAFEGIVI